MNHAGLMALQQSLLHGFTAKDAKRTDRFPDWKVAVMLDEEFAKAGVERPQGKFSGYRDAALPKVY